MSTGETREARSVPDRLEDLRRAITIFVVVAILGAVAVSAVWYRLGKVAEVQQDGIERGYKQRAIPCVALATRPGSGIPRYCVEKDALPYVCVAARDVDAATLERVESQAGRACSLPSS